MSKERIIFDTDIGGDCDDAGALALCHALCELGEAELLAVTACYSNQYVAGCIDAINTHYGRIVPIGMNYNKTLIRKPHPVNNYCGYDRVLCEEFPNSYKNGESVPDSVDLLREILSKEEDGSVTLVATGAFTNLARLIMSPADEISPLTGKELVARKLKRTVVMGGRFFETWPMEIISGGKPMQAEYNIAADIPSVQTVCDNWSVELVFSSYEIGLWCVTLEDFALRAETNPAARAYKGFPYSKNGRESWDLTAMLYAIRPDGGYYNTHPKGIIHTDDAGVTRIKTRADGEHTYIIPRVDYAEVRRVINELVKGSKYY